MKKIIFYLIVFLGITSFKSVGSATAYLNCKSESGRTLFKAEIQDIDGGLENAELTIDGVKIDFADNWVHLRKSNTEPIIRIYTEAKSQKEADNLAIRIIDEIKDIARI